MSLPVPEELPTVVFKQPLEIAFLYYGASTAETQEKVREAYADAALTKRRLVVSLYDTVNHSILLPENWTAQDPAQLSMVVHELVHHLQTSSGLRYPCPQEREALAYTAQEKWLGEFGTNLEREFGMDQMTLFVSTHCML
jgi:hypothetical protein